MLALNEVEGSGEGLGVRAYAVCFAFSSLARAAI